MTGDVTTGRAAVALFWECRGDELSGSAVSLTRQVTRFLPPLEAADVTGIWCWGLLNKEHIRQLLTCMEQKQKRNKKEEKRKTDDGVF